MRCVSSLHCQKVYWVYISLSVWMHVYRYSINASTPMNYIFTEFYTISRFYVTLYLLSYCVFRFSWCRAYIYIYVCVYMCIYICMYVYVCVYICVHVYMYIYACECMLLCIHDYMYVFYVCSFYVYWFYDVFYLWLLGQRWPNKEVQTKHPSIWMWSRREGLVVSIKSILYKFDRNINH